MAPAQAAPEVEIAWHADQPAWAKADDHPVEAHAAGLRLRVPGIAAFDVQPAQIDVFPAADAEERSVRTYLYGSAIGALLHVRGLTVLHGSTVRLPDGTAAVICGHSTAGKSTLAAALAMRGMPLLADDVTAVQLDAQGQAWCLPGLARTKLWRTALDRLGLSTRASEATRLMPTLDKHVIALDTWPEPAPVRHLVELDASGSVLGMRPIRGMDRLTVLMAQVYRPGYLHAMQQEARLLRQAAAIAPQLQMLRVVRPRDGDTPQPIIDGLLREWGL